MPIQSRFPAYAIILGAVLDLPVRYLFLLTHGPYEQPFDRLVWGLNHHDYSRWAIFPALLILPGLLAFNRWMQNSYGKAGYWGFRLVFGGAVIIVAAQIWMFVLFDPFEHPMHGIGWILQFLALLTLLFIGMPLWTLAVFRSEMITGWQKLIPVLWVLFILAAFIHVFTADENWLFPRFGVDGGFIGDFFTSISYVLVGLTLLEKGKIA